MCAQWTLFTGIEEEDVILLNRQVRLPMSGSVMVSGVRSSCLINSTCIEWPPRDQSDEMGLALFVIVVVVIDRHLMKSRLPIGKKT